jgi:hypothetical protein
MVTLQQVSANAPWYLSERLHARRARAQVTRWMVRDEIVEPLKPVPVGVAPPGKSVLVDTQRITRLPTAAR